MNEVKEIDLLELFLSLFLFVKKKIIILLLAFLFGASIGFTFKKLQKEKYHYPLTINCPNLPTQIIYKEIALLNDLLVNTNRDSIFTNMDIPVETMKKVKSIGANATKESSSRIAVDLIAFNMISEQEFTDVLTKYLLNNKYIQESLALSETELKETISFIDNQLNSVKKNDSSNEARIEYIFTDETPTDLFIQKKGYLRQLKFHAPFIVENYPLLPKLKGYGLIVSSFFGGCISTLLILLFFVFRFLNAMSTKNP